MGVADYAFDGGSCPPALSRALNYRSWGVSDVMQLPAGMLPQMNTSLNCYDAITGYLRASSKIKTNEWIKQYPKQWETVSWFIAERGKRKYGSRTE